jgi:hypothetical protein
MEAVAEESVNNVNIKLTQAVCICEVGDEAEKARRSEYNQE